MAAKMVYKSKQGYSYLESMGKSIGADKIEIIANTLDTTPQELAGWITEGQWVNIDSQEQPYKIRYKCSLCGRSITIKNKDITLEDYPYCHCGARNKRIDKPNIS